MHIYTGPTSHHGGPLSLKNAVRGKEHPAYLERPLGLLVLALILLVFLQSVACDSATENGLSTLRLANSRNEVIHLKVEVADTAAQRQVGLSGRDSLAENEGMFFVFERRGAGFWMKDTRIPLSAAFISDCGEIVSIVHMEPLSLDLHQTESPYAFGLEVNAGWFEKHSIRVGNRIEIPKGLGKSEC